MKFPPLEAELFHADGRKDGRKDGRTDGRRDGRTDGWMDGWMDGWISFVTSVCLSAFTNAALTVRILGKIDPGGFYEFHRVTPNPIKVGHQYRSLSRSKRVFHIFGGNIGKSTIGRTHDCASFAQLSIFVTLLTANCVRQLYKLEGIYVSPW